MSNSMLNIQIQDMQQLLNFLGDLGDKAPRQALAKGVRKGANNILREAKGDAPVYSGTMASSLKLKTEKGNTKKLKVVIDIMFDPALTSVFQKSVEEPGIYGGTPNSSGKYYYPGSMEYGFKTAKGWHQGHYFLKKARDDNDTNFGDTIEQALQDEIDRLG